MPSTRQDAWTQDEDLLLAEVVLRNIREGGTQLKAFQEVGKQLSRTAAACGFRWNSYVRKQYKSGIDLAKKQRKELKKQGNSLHPTNQEENHEQDYSVNAYDSQSAEGLNFSDVLNYLQGLNKKAEEKQEHSILAKNYENKIKELEKKAYYLAAENEKLTNELKTVQRDYRALVEIMERARKMIVLGDEKVKLEKVEK